MIRRTIRIGAAIALILPLVWMLQNDVAGQAGQAGQTSQASTMPSTQNGEWPMYTADLRGSKYSPLSQIDASNFSKLQPVWTFKTDSLGPTIETKLEGTPLMVKGTVYLTGGTRRAVVALDAKTGEQKWVYSLDEGARAAASPRKLSGRGVSYWTDGRGDERILYVTIGYRLVSLNAKTGQPIPTFGKNGMIDLKEGVVVGKDKQIDLERGEIGLHSTPTIVNDTVIVGSSMEEGLSFNYRTSLNTKGLVRAFDVRTGKQIWRFNTIPYPGQFGNETWEDGSWEWTGNVGVWTQITVDPEAGLVYLPVETPTLDEYGGNRPGNNLFSESLVAVDLKTGTRKWHFQLVHHPLWDHDISSAPLLIDATIDGRPRKLVAQPTKQAYLYVFDRITGEPIWPIPERPVPQSNVPGEKTSPTQPIPTKPAPYSRPFLALDDVIDFTPALRAQALENLKRYVWEPTPYIAPALPNGQILGAINVGNTVGGINWPGASFDPETATFYGQAHNSAITTSTISETYLQTVNPDTQRQGRGPVWDLEAAGRGGPRGRGVTAAATATAGAARGRGAAPGAAATTPAAPATTAAAATGRGGLTTGLEGLSIAKPPYGVLTAIDLNTGNTKWQVPHGDTPDSVRNTLQRLGVTYTEKTGQPGSVGLMVTKTLVVVGDPQVTTPPGRARGAMLRAYDKQTGKEVGAVLMPMQQSGSPMTYMVDGRQFIIVAVQGTGGADAQNARGGQYIAYALPAAAR
jgi:quinoprotein glucose dehydrogenase